MSFLKNWFVDRPADAPTKEASLLAESVPVALAPVMATLGILLGENEPALLEGDVARAKFADICRDLGIEPLDPLEMDSISGNLDRAGWERFSLLVLVLERFAIPKDLLRRIFQGRLRTAVREGLVEVARASELVTMEKLRDGPLRREELTRRLILGLGASVAGENMPEARAALERLDYGRLMAEAERAKRGVLGK